MSSTSNEVDSLSPVLAELVAKDRIREVLCRYTRGIDRRDFDLVRSCYHPDAYDDHGGYRGDVDGLMDYVRASLANYTNTMHFLGNMIIELNGSTAEVETYAIAIHRLPPRPGKLKRDITLMLRYVDVLEERAGEWRISNRVCVYDWGRLDSDIDGREMLGEAFVRGQMFPDDPVYAAHAH